MSKLGFNIPWEKFLTVVKIYGAIAAAVTVIASFAVKYDRKAQNEIKVNSSIDTLICMTKAIDIRLNRIENVQIDMNGDLVEVGDALKATQESFVSYLSKDSTLSKSDFLFYMKNFEFEIKKNSFQMILPNGLSQLYL